MLTTERKANSDQHGKSLEEIAPVGKAIWHRPAVRRLATEPATGYISGNDTDANGGDKASNP